MMTPIRTVPRRAIMLGGLVLAAMLLAAPSGDHVARAEGALAIGQTGDIAEDGFAFGFSYGYSNREDAEARALAECRGVADAEEDVRALCKIVANFKDACIAVAYDPEEGQPGFGWALGVDEASAEARALARCRETAGPGRQDFCKVAESACDRS